MVTAVWAVRDKQFNCSNCGAVLTVIKMYRYIVYVEILLLLIAGRDGTMVTIRSLNLMYGYQKNHYITKVEQHSVECDVSLHVHVALFPEKTNK